MTHGTDAGQSPSGSVLGQTLMVTRRLRERLPDGITRVTRFLVWTTLVVQTLVVGTGGALAAWLLVQLITLVTNLAWFGRLDTMPVSMAAAARTPWMVFVPILGGLVIGAMARFGSEKIRGHGIPEAIEAILIGGVGHPD